MRCALVAAISVALLAGGAARAQPVDVLLVLAADTSRSINDAEFDLQRRGYAAALSDPRVLAAIRGGGHGAIALCYVEWSGMAEQDIVADWAVVADKESAEVMAATIRKAPRAFAGRTSISGAIDFAMRRFAAATVQGGRRIIDISGDGTSNAGRSLAAAREAALAQGVTINGLVIINDVPDTGYRYHTHPPGGLAQWYRQNVIGGPGAFLHVVDNFETFADAIAEKLAAEIAALPQRQAARRGGRARSRAAAARYATFISPR